MRVGHLIVFVWPLVALYAFGRGGAWTWLFVPVVLGLGMAELVGLWWSRRTRRAAEPVGVRAMEPSEGRSPP